MLIRLIILLALTSQFGCEYFSEHQKGKVKWAMVDKGKIYTTFFDTFKKNNPYPAELAPSEEFNHSVDLLRKQISQIELSARENCDKSNQTYNKQLHSKETNNNTIILPSGKRIIRALPNSGSLNSIDSTESYNKAYYECLTNIKEDPLLADLQDKLKEMNNTNNARRKFDEDIRKQFDTFVKTATQKYAQQNEYEIILNNSPENILYSSDKIYLQATDDIIDFISKNGLLSTSANNN